MALEACVSYRRLGQNKPLAERDNKYSYSYNYSYVNPSLIGDYLEWVTFSKVLVIGSTSIVIGQAAAILARVRGVLRKEGHPSSLPHHVERIVMDTKFKVGEEVLDTESGQVGIIRQVYKDKRSGEFEYYVEFLQQILEGGVLRQGFPRLMKGRVCLESELEGGGQSWVRRWYNRMFR